MGGDGEQQNQEDVGWLWVKRASAAAALCGLIYGFITEYDRSLSSLFDVLVTGVVFGVVALVLLGGTFFVVSNAMTQAGHYKTPCAQGAMFVVWIFTGLAIIDLIFNRGSMIIMPAITLLFTGDLSGTFWGCEGEWISVDEGSYCAEDD